MKRVRVVLTSLLIFITAGSIATPPECVFERYSSLDGLPHNAISDICHDNKGFVWICTWYGLSRFDGYKFKNYRTLPGDYSPLSHNRFLKVTEDAMGYLWLTTYDNKLFRFDRNKEHFEDIPHSVAEYSDKNYKIDQYLCTKDAHTWIALSGAGLINTNQNGEQLEIVNYFDNPNVGNKIEHIFEGKEAIWIVSEIGISMFKPSNGTYDISLVSSENDISDIVELDNMICFGTNGHVIVINKNTQKIDTIAIVSGDRVTALEKSNDNTTLYIGTKSTGIAQYNLSTRQYTPDTSRPGRIRDIVCDSKGILWITTAQAGITRYRPQSRDYKHFSQPMNVVSYYVDTVTQITERGDDLWIKMNRFGFGYYDRSKDTVEPFYNDPTRPDCRMSNGVTCFEVDSTNVLWISTYSRGLEKITIIDQKAEIFAPHNNDTNKAANEIRALTIDKQGNTWMATKNDELFCYSAKWELLHKFPNNNTPKLGMIYTIKCDRSGNIWLGTKGNGAFRLEPSGSSFKFTHFVHNPSQRYSISNNIIYSIEQDHAGRIWFGSYGGGISMLESPASDQFITSLNHFPNYPDHGQKVRFMLSTPDKKMMAGTVEGLITFDPDDAPQKTNFKLSQKIPGDAHSLGNNDIIHIMTDSKSDVWLSTFGGGLNKLSGYDDQGQPRFEIYSMEHGLSSNIVFASTADHRGNIWMSTENGISKLDIITNRISNYSKYDGIPPATFSEATAATNLRGEVMFGSINNLFIIQPENIQPTQDNYRLTFTNLEVRNHDVVIGKDAALKSSISESSQIILPYDYSIFRIEYASLNFKMQPRLGYMYILEGFDTDWNIVDNIRSASYSNIPHGTYRFKVSCYAEGDQDAGEEISINITILPPPWKSPLAYLCYAIIAILLMWAVIKILYTMLALRNKIGVEQKMTELKLRFFTNISHELRTPLTLILGGVEEVRKSEILSDRGTNNINLAFKNSKRMLNLINQILDFRKIVNEKMKLKVSRVDIIEIAQSVLDDFKEVAKEHNIELLFTVSDKSLFVWVDPERIEGVIYNLLSNAFKFTPDGQKIGLSISHREAEPIFSISVNDSGIGIAKDKQEIIFERFAQVSGDTHSVAKGSGIGLALCKEITQMHHGEISVESRQNGGSTFTVKLKMGNSHFAMNQIDFADIQKTDSNVSQYLTDDNQTESQNRIDTQPPQDAPLILLVEDNTELRTFIYNHLIDSYRVAEAADGQEALNKIAEQQPDIIITDLMMPVMDGIELTNRVRKDFNTSHIPLIMLTAKLESQARIEAMKYGADGYITKPFSIELLLVRIDNLLTRRHQLFEKYSSQAAGVAKIIDLSPTEIIVTDRDETFIKNTMSWIDANIENSELTIEQLSSHLGMGRTTMYNKLKSLTGKSPVELIKEYRVTKSMLMLKSGQYSVSEVAYKVGFSDPGYFSKCFKEHYKMSPAEFIKSL